MEDVVFMFHNICCIIGVSVNFIQSCTFVLESMLAAACVR